MRHNNNDEHNHARLQRELLQLLARARQKPYLPIWGELFCNLRQFKRIADSEQTDLELYPLEPTGQLRYEYETGKFVARVPELNLHIALGLEECADALANGRFLPAPPDTQPAAHEPLPGVISPERAAYDMSET
ncbi:hypothetical protein [Brevibacillus marinus]|uniref:hypothetical protein n=1 Tax=Brevibacillus marinus TaxID=2496837 RepID=UPI000F816409|nr:hypothetical protein [Brevibacillus marinus]